MSWDSSQRPAQYLDKEIQRIEDRTWFPCAATPRQRGFQKQPADLVKELEYDEHGVPYLITVPRHRSRDFLRSLDAPPPRSWPEIYGFGP